MAKILEETFERKLAQLKAQGVDDFEDGEFIYSFMVNVWF